MTITRLVTLTAETQTVNDLAQFVGANVVISSTKARTGTYSYRLPTTGNAMGRGIGSQSSLRLGYWINHVGIGTGGKVNLIIVSSGTDDDESPMLRVLWDDDTGTIDVLRATGPNTWESLASISPPASLLATDTWIHLGFTLFCHATTGFLSMYVNGVKVIALIGDTRLSRNNAGTQEFSATFSSFWFGGRTRSTQTTWANFTYFDDIYVDTYDSELDAPVPARRYLTRIANGAGVDAEWTPLASTNVSQIDDGAPDGGANDGDTTYNHTDTLDERDTFTKNSVTIPTGYRIVGMVLFAHCKTLDVGPEISLHLHDGSTYADGDDLVPPFDYTIEVSHRFSAQPDASAFNETDVNNLSIGYASRGSFT